MFKSAAAALLLSIAAMPVTSHSASAETKSAIFAGGCFWCVEKDFDNVRGVVATTSGYSGGTLENPTYENHDGHREVVKIDFDPAKVDYATLVSIFLRSVDPTDAGGQFCDRGFAYSTAIYTFDAEQKSAAQAAKADAEAALGQAVVTPIEPAATFWPAEDYHQNYYKRNPVRYKYYRYSCGRDARVGKLWGDAAHQGIAGF